MGHHKERTDLGREFGATDVIAERGDEGIEQVRDLTGGDGTHTVLECVGTREAIEMALGAVRAGGVVSRVGAPQYTEVTMDFGTFLRNITLTGGVAPARAYIEELMPDILEGRGGEATVIRPGDTIWTPPGEWHWHGAAPDHFMTHLAMWEGPGEGQGPETEWGALVTDAEYDTRPVR